MLQRRWLIHRPQEQGVSMAVVMLVLLSTILGSIAIASRSSSGLLAARSQSSNREARDVAESGVTEIISELNKEQNRKLLILPVANWNAAAVNPCSGIDSTGASVSPVPTPTNKALNLSANWTDLTSGDTTRQYRLDTASATTTARAALSGSPSSNQLQGTEKTLFSLTVSGRIRDAAGNLISTATITREYEVVPKCCKRSFGRNSTSATIYGDDTRTCFAGASGGLGIVVGINGGSLSTSNNAFDMTDQNGLPITRVLCARTTGTSVCNDGTLRLGSSISVVPTTFSTPFPPTQERSPLPETSTQGQDHTSGSTQAAALPSSSSAPFRDPPFRRAQIFHLAQAGPVKLYRVKPGAASHSLTARTQLPHSIQPMEGSISTTQATGAAEATLNI